jgi:membrane protein YqaA with SNARE-associated domain
VGFLGTLATTFGYCALGGVVPLLNAELYLLALSKWVPRDQVLWVTIAATLGQMVGKSATYFVARAALGIPSEKFRRTMAAVEARYKGKESVGGALIFVSALVGIPPFYLISVACGLLHISFVQFLVLGLIGRFLHFGAMLLGPQLLWFGR